MDKSGFRSLLVLAAFAAMVPLAVGLVVSGPGAANQKLPDVPAPFEQGEEQPGGSATSQQSIDNRDAFSHFSHGIGLEGESRFKIGNAIFRRLWAAAPSSTQSADGLGPLYNARGCQNCHLKDGRGRPPAANWPAENAVSMFLRISIPPETGEQKELLRSHRANVIPDPVYGDQLQNTAIHGLDAEGHMHIEYEEVPVELAAGQVVKLRKPTYSVTELAFGPLHPKAMLSPRVAPQMIGLGLLEAIPEAAIRANADPDDANQDGISGRTNEVWSMAYSQVMLGRFGWKAGMPTVHDQSASAAAGDIGLSTSLVPKPAGDCTAAQAKCMAAPNGNSERAGGYEIGDDLMALVTFYTQNLAVPARRKPPGPRSPARKSSVQVVWLRRLPHALVHHRHGHRAAAPQQSAHLALHRPAAARYGRGTGRWQTGRRGRRARVAHGPAMGRGADGHRQRSHIPFA